MKFNFGLQWLLFHFFRDAQMHWMASRDDAGAITVTEWAWEAGHTFPNPILCYQISSSLATSMEVSLGTFANQFEMNYSSTSVDWANFVCEPMKFRVHENMACIQMSAVVEINESLFGRRVKYPRGNWDYMVTVGSSFAHLAQHGA